MARILSNDLGRTPPYTLALVLALVLALEPRFTKKRIFNHEKKHLKTLSNMRNTTEQYLNELFRLIREDSWEFVVPSLSFLTTNRGISSRIWNTIIPDFAGNRINKNNVSFFKSI